jgi:glycosyltransferase involved in cell wall biosynthesis
MQQPSAARIYGAEAIKVRIIIATYGDESWAEMAVERAAPSTEGQGAHEVFVGHDPLGTIASARNEIAKQAEGDWLLFLDADDEIAPGFLVAMKRALQQERRVDGTPLLLTPAVSYIKNGKRRSSMFHPECSLETGNWLIIGTLVERDLFQRVGGFEEYPHGLEDWQFWAKCVKAGARIAKVPRAVYRAHWNDISKHRELARNRPEYMRHYEAARASVWG